jgi:hypothetical protein
MAVVGEAHILVRAITTEVARDISNGVRRATGSFNAAGRSAGETMGEAFNRGFSGSTGKNPFTKIADGLRAMAPEAEAARLQFRSLVRTGYTVGTALTAIVGGIAAVIGGLVALIGALGQASIAAFGVVTAFVQLRTAFAFFSFGMRGIGQAVSAANQQMQGLGKSTKQVQEEFQQLLFTAEDAALSESRAAINLEQALERLRSSADLPPNSTARREAQLAYDEAELAYRRAKARTQDLNEEVAKGPQALNQATGQDPYAGLTESQREFAKFLTELTPKIDILREKVAKGFLPELETQIDNFVTRYFPTLETKFEEIGVALGKAVTNLGEELTDEESQEELTLFFDNLIKNLPKFGTILGNIADIFLKLFNDADGVGTRFLDSVLATTTRWNQSLEENGLTDLFNSAGDTAAQFGTIFGNIITGLGEFFKAVTGPGSGGQIMLDYLKEITGQFASIDGEARGAGSVSQFFTDLANNAVPVLNFLGDIIDIFMEIGANPNIGKAFEALTTDENKDNWRTIFQSFADAAPSLANLAVVIGEILAGFADSEAPKAFFDTIRQLITPLAQWISDPENKAIVDTIGKIFATLSAIGFVIGTVKFAFNVFLGNIIFALATLGSLFGNIFGGFKRVGGFFGKFVGGIKELAPFVKDFGVALSGLFKAIGLKIKLMLATLNFRVKLFLLKFKLAAIKALFNLGPLLTNAFIFVKTYLQAFFPWVLNGARVLLTGIGTLLRFLGGPWGLLIGLLITGLQLFFTKTEAGKKIWEGFTSFVSDSLKNLGDFFGTIFENITKGWEDMVNFFKSLDPIEGLKNVGQGIGDWFSGLFGPDRPGISVPGLAQGGTVMPSSGGTLVRVAEAGRPERVEPLDDRGLSRRDYAMITALSGGRGGINVTVNPSAGMDERELAEMVSRKIALEIRRGII